MFKQSEGDLQVYFSQVLQIAGGRIGVKDADWKSSVELIDGIKDLKGPLMEKLDTFFPVYRQWWESVTWLDEEKKSGCLTDPELAKLQELISARDATREEFIAML